MEPEAEWAMQGLRAFLFEHVYFNSAAKAEEKKACGVIRELYRYFAAHPESVPEGARASSQTGDAAVIACDYTAGMTDQFAIAMYKRIFIPLAWQG